MLLTAQDPNDPLNLFDPEGLSALKAITSLTETMVEPYVGFYQRSIVGTTQTALGAIAQTPLGDPGFYASIQGAGPPGALVGGIGSIFSYGIRSLAGLGELGPATTLTNITRPGSQFSNFSVNVGAAEFQSNLLSNGYNITKQGPVSTVLSNDINTYAIYTRSSTQGPGAHFIGGNGNQIKYSLSGP